MSVTRKLAAVAAFAAIATLGMGAPANAGIGSDNGSNKASLVDVSRNNVGPIQLCHNNVPVNVLGVQVPVQDVVANLGLLGSASGNYSEISKDCVQMTKQVN